MADNFARFSVLSSMPSNIAVYGNTREEVLSQKGTPSKNPVESPMANPAVSSSFLALERNTSDDLRMQQQPSPTVDPYQGPTLTITLNRAALGKLDGKLLNTLQKVVNDGIPGVNEDIKGLMQDSFRRLGNLQNTLSGLQKMAEGVYLRSILSGRG